MTPDQITLVQTSFEYVKPIAGTAAELFYQRLFELDPTLQPLFKGDMTEQGRKLMDMLSVAVAGLGRLDALVPAVQKLGARHVSYGVKPEDYTTVGVALLWTLERGLGERFTPEIRVAWTEAYVLLADAMRAEPLTLRVAVEQVA